MAAHELRIVTPKNWWNPGMGLTQDLFVSSELVRLRNNFWRPGDSPGGEFYEKYLVTLSDGREVLFSNRVSDVIGICSGGSDTLIDWAVGEGLSGALGQPVLRGIHRESGKPIEVRGSWRSIDSMKEHLSEYCVELDHSESRIQPWDQYSPLELQQIHRASFDDRFRTRDKAGEFGTQSHDLISKWLFYHHLQERVVVNGETVVSFDRIHFLKADGSEWAIHLDKEPVEVQNSCRAFHGFWLAQELEVVATEQFLADLAAGVAGTVDCIARTKKGEIICLDWKTGKGIYSTQLLQVIAYCWFWFLWSGVMVSRAYIVRLDKLTGQVQVVPVFVNEQQRDALLAAWAHAVNLHSWDKSANKYLKGFQK